MQTVARTIVGACLAVAVIAPVSATAAPAQPDARVAAAKSFTVVQTFQKAKLGVCKVSVSDGAAWRVYGRLDTRRVTAGKYVATLYVLQAGKDAPVAMWRSPQTRKGTFSTVGSVRLPRKAGFSLDGGVGGANAGDGGSIKMSSVGRC